MPRLIEPPQDGTATLDDLIDACRAPAFDPDDRDSLEAVAPALRALANDRRFLADFVIGALKDRCAGQRATNSYSPQVILLHPPGEGFFIRANIWPSRADLIYRSTGGSAFFYDMPHDHAFDFLTVGYLGPGYWSDYYEHDGAGSAWAPGETVGLRFVERSRLEQGKMLLYRANQDVHDQKPADSLSVSINVIPLSPRQAWRRQYLFDVGERRVVDALTTTSAELLLRLSIQFGQGDGVDLAEDFARRHPEPPMRLAAWEALASAEKSDLARAGRWDRAAADPAPLVRDTAARQLGLLRNGADRAGAMA
jgi:hypothetical protein